MRVALISYYDSSRIDQFPAKHSLGALRLAAYVAANRPTWTVRVRSFPQDQAPASIASRLSEEGFDVVGLPAYIWTREQSRLVAGELLGRTNRPLVVVGGPETRSMSLTGWPTGTIFALGQGELPLLAVCDQALLRGADPATFTAESPIPIFGTAAERRRVLHLSEPTRDDKRLPHGLPLYGPQAAVLCQGDEVDDRFVWSETARGCIYSCSFCGHNTLPFFATFDDTFMVREIKNLAATGVTSTFVIDPILGGRPRRGKAVLRAFQGHASDVSLRAYMRPEFLDDEFVDELAASNITELLMGLQTTNPAVPGHVRGNNFTKIMKVVPELADRGIPWRAELIVGLPGDTEEGLRESFRFVIDELQPRSIYAYHLTAIPDTQIHKMIDKHDDDFWITTDGRLRVVASNSFDDDAMYRMRAYAGAVMSRHGFLQQAGVPSDFSMIHDDVMEKLATAPETMASFARLDMQAGMEVWGRTPHTSASDVVGLPAR